jgi:hypothetical protein
MFADVSGFTMLSEKLASKGLEVAHRYNPKGPELLAQAINGYMELLSQKVSQSGGDIFKFAGDAMIILWTPREANEGEDGPSPDPQQELRKLCVLARNADRGDPGGAGDPGERG